MKILLIIAYFIVYFIVGFFVALSLHPTKRKRYELLDLIVDIIVIALWPLVVFVRKLNL